MNFRLLISFLLLPAFAFAAPRSCPNSYADMARPHVEEPISAYDWATLIPDIPGAAGLPSMPRDQAPDVPGYHLTKVLGQGGEGYVFEAIPEGKNYRVAIKVLNQPKAGEELALLRLVQKEGGPGARYVVRGLGSPNPNHLVVERGELSLYELLREGNGLTRERTDTILSQVREAIEAFHKAGYVHADIKPGNILIAQNGEVRIADVGIAVRIGTPHRGHSDSYSSANQVARGKASPEDDWHAFNVLAQNVRSWGANPLMKDADVAFLAANVGLSAAEYRKGRDFDWNGFYSAALQRAKDMDHFLHPRSVELLRSLGARVPADRSKDLFEVGSKEYRFELALSPKENLLAAKQELEQRFEVVRTLASEPNPDWEEIAEVLHGPMPAVEKLGIDRSQTIGGHVVPLKNFREMKADDNEPSDVEGTIIFGGRGGWFRGDNRVVGRGESKVALPGGEIVDIKDPRLLEYPDARAAVLRTRQSAGMRDVLLGTEEYGHLLQDLSLLTTGNHYLAEPLLAKIHRANPDLTVEKIPMVNAMVSPGGQERGRQKAIRRDYVLYTAEADIYLYMISVLGKRNVPRSYGTQSSYWERINLFQRLP